MSGRAVAVALLAAVAAVLPQDTRAQDVRTDLTLGEALELAARHNPSYRRALNDMSLAGPQARAAWGAFLPRLDLSAGTGYGFNERSVGTDNFGNPIENPVVQRLWNSSADQGLNFSVALFEGGGRFAGMSEARARADATAWAARAALGQAEAEIKRQYFLALRANEFLDLESELLAARRDDLTATQRLFEIATRSQSDLLGAELEVQRQERERETQEAERAKAMVALRTAIGDPNLRLEGVAAEVPPPLDPSALDLDALVERALLNRPEVHQRLADRDVAEASLRVAKAARWPSIILSGGYNRQAFGPDADFLFDLNPDASKYGSFRLNVNLPLFQQFSTSASIAEAEVRRDNAMETLREIRLDTERDVLQALIDLRSRFRALELSASARDVAERRLALVREEYRLAVKNFTELQDAIGAAASAHREEIQARFDYATAFIELELLVGGPVSTDGNP